MTEIEKKAEENWDKCILKDINEPAHWAIHEHHVQAYKDGYEQGQKDFDTDVTKLLNSYGVTFIDTNSIGGLIALHQLILDLEKENEELKATISKMEKVTAEKNSSLLKELTERVKQQAELIEEYKIGVTERNNEIKVLIAQIERMINCHNCKHCGYYKYFGIDNGVSCELKNCAYYDKWELAK